MLTAKLIPKIEKGKLIFKQIGKTKDLPLVEILNKPETKDDFIKYNIFRFFLRKSQRISKNDSIKRF